MVRSQGQGKGQGDSFNGLNGRDLFGPRPRQHHRQKAGAGADVERVGPGAELCYGLHDYSTIIRRLFDGYLTVI